MRAEQLPEVLLQNELIFWKQKLTSVISKHHGCLEKPVTFPFRHHNSILNMSLFTMPYLWASSVWLVTQMLILLLGQFVQLWPQSPSLSICLLLQTHLPWDQACTSGTACLPYPPEKYSSIVLLLFCPWDLTQVLSPSYEYIMSLKPSPSDLSIY